MRRLWMTRTEVVIQNVPKAIGLKLTCKEKKSLVWQNVWMNHNIHQQSYANKINPFKIFTHDEKTYGFHHPHPEDHLRSVIKTRESHDSSY